MIPNNKEEGETTEYEDLIAYMVNDCGYFTVQTPHDIINVVDELITDIRITRKKLFEFAYDEQLRIEAMESTDNGNA